MTEQDLIDAGFERVDVSAKESGCDNDFHYYDYIFCSTFSLITPASNEVENGWFVEVFEAPEIRIKGRAELFDFIDTIERHLNKK
jgi:hypothetical protein